MQEMDDAIAGGTFLYAFTLFISAARPGGLVKQWRVAEHRSTALRRPSGHVLASTRPPCVLAARPRCARATSTFTSVGAFCPRS